MQVLDRSQVSKIIEIDENQSFECKYFTSIRYLPGLTSLIPACNVR